METRCSSQNLDESSSDTPWRLFYSQIIDQNSSVDVSNFFLHLDHHAKFQMAYNKEHLKQYDNDEPYRCTTCPYCNGERDPTVKFPKPSPREFWESIGSPQLVVAPMVEQSELPFRMLCRKFGATLAYTPMFC